LDQERLLIGPPVIVLGDQGAISVMRFQHGIAQHAAHTQIGERRADGPNNNVR
jgi:hypothetical protein